MTDTAVDRLYGEASASIIALQKIEEFSLQMAVSDNLRKALLLASASYFEVRVSSVVLEFVRESAGGGESVVEFVRNKAISRQYHTWFAWDKANANQFFGLFGEVFKAKMEERIKQSEELQVAVRAFLEIGRERNRLVHQDYATFALEKTLEEIYDLYKKAIVFIEGLPAYFRDEH